MLKTQHPSFKPNKHRPQPSKQTLGNSDNVMTHRRKITPLCVGNLFYAP